tara:strand:+ start:2579 stop:3019 length:441 start_codon:yes stop_codon:yes gene_type:complete
MVLEIDGEWIATKDADENVIQVRVNGGGSNLLHIQGYGKVTANRDYGFAHKFNVPQEMCDFMSHQQATHLSFASVEKLYIRTAKVVQYDDGIQLLVGSDTGIKGNNSHSYVLDLNTNKESVKMFIDFLVANGLLMEVQGKRWIADE